MLLGVDKRLNGLIFVLSLLLFSAFSHAAPSCASWTTIGRSSCIINGTCQDKDGGESVTTSCDLSDFTPQKATCGDKSKKHNKVLTRMDKTGITITYAWHERGSFHDGYFQADDQINFKVPQQFAPPLLSAIKKALSQNNCQAAKRLMDGANNGQLCDGGAYCFSSENEDGTKNQCGIMSDGTSKCKVSKGNAEETNPDGTPRIKIDCAAGEDCRTETDLDGYANMPDKKQDNGETGGSNGDIKNIKGNGGQSGDNSGGDGKNNQGNSGSSGGSGSDGPDKRGNTGNNVGTVGSGNANNGKSSNTKTENDSDKQGGQDNSNTDKTGDSNVKGSDQDGNGKGSSGSGTGSGGGGGSGVGNGKGNKEGDGKGDGDGDKDTADVDLFDAPSMKETFAPLVKVLKDKFSAKVDIGGGDCPKPQFNLMGRSFTVSAHCEILAQLREYFATLMMFLYTFTAIRIVLSS